MVRGALLIVAMALALSVSSGTAGAAYFGYNDNSTLRGQFTPARDSQLLAGAAANSMRIDVDWSWVEKSPGALDLSLYDGIYHETLARGIRPLMSVMGSPRWAWPALSFCLFQPECHYAPDRSKDAAWGRFVGAVAQRFPEAAAIEIWNEPNLKAFYMPAPNPLRYTELLRIGRAAVKAVAPTMPVLGGSLAAVLNDSTSGDGYGLRPFLRGMYNAGARGLMDGISIHAYPKNSREGFVYEALNSTLETRNDAGDTVPVWISEVGASTTAGYSEGSQAAFLGDMVPRLLRRPSVRGVYVHTLADQRWIGFDAENGYGILHPNGAPKLAFCAIVHAVGGQTACVGLPPDGTALARGDAQEWIQRASEAALEYRRQTGTYAGLTLGALHGIDPGIAADPPPITAEPGAGADPSRIAVQGVYGRPDAVRLCNASREVRSYCVTAIHGGPWYYTTARGSIAAVLAATNGGTAQLW